MNISRLFYQGNLPNNLMSSGSSTTVFQSRLIPLAEQAKRSTLLVVDIHNSVLNSSTHSQQQYYSPYGQRQPELLSWPTLGYNGQLQWPLSLLYFLGNGYRAYSPKLMRFLSADSSSPFERGGINIYSYCSGDPINHTDPTGHMKLDKQQLLSIKANTLKVLAEKREKRTPGHQQLINRQRAAVKTIKLNAEEYPPRLKNAITRINKGKNLIETLQKEPDSDKTKTLIDLINIGNHMVAYKHDLPTPATMGSHPRSAYFTLIAETATEAINLLATMNNSIRDGVVHIE